MKNYSLPSILAGILFSLVLPSTLYHFRLFDNNSFCRWDWVFADGPPRILFWWTVAIAGGSFWLARLSWPKNPPLFLTALAFLIGISFWGEPEILIDASRYFSQAKYLEIHGIRAFWQQWGGELSAWTDLPLVPFFYGLVFTGLGESRFFIQTLTTLFFTGSVLLTYFIARDYWDEETGLLAGLLLLCHPYLLLHVPLMMVDLPTMFFLLLTIYTFSRALLSGSPAAILLAAISIFFLFWAKYSTWILLSVLPIILLIHYPNDRQRSRLVALIIIGLALLLILPLFIVLQDVILAQIGLLIEYQKPGLSRWTESFLSTFFSRPIHWCRSAPWLVWESASSKKSAKFCSRLT